MKVYELIQELLEAPAGAKVYIRVSPKLLEANEKEEVILEMVIKSKEGVIVTTK